MWKLYIPLLKPGLTASIVLTAVASAFAARRGLPPLDALIPLVVVAFLASSGSCAVNNFLDRDIDGVMARTKNRPLPSRRIRHPRKAFWMGLLLISASLIVSQLFLNSLVTFHLFMGTFVYLVIYTVWLKRRSSLNIVIGGLAGSFAVLAGGASARPELCLPPLLVGLVIFLWTPTHFWSLAIARRDDYKDANIPMLPVLTGNRKAARYIFINTNLLVLASILPFIFGLFGPIYLASTLSTGAFLMLRNLQLLKQPTALIAAKNFRASMLYLFVLLLSIIADTLLLTASNAL